MSPKQHFQLLFIPITVIAFAFLPFNTSESSPKLLDLTHDIDANAIGWDKNGYSVAIIMNETIPGTSKRIINEEITIPVHFGTHIDAPCFLTNEKWCTEAIPLNRLVLPAVLIDISDKVRDNPDVHLTPLDLINWEVVNGPIPNGSLVLIHTGWSQFWKDPLKYKGTQDYLRFPSISADAAQWLVNFRNIYAVGIDSLSLDVNDNMFLSHNFLLSKGIYGIENLCNLHLVPATGSIAYVMPMKLKGLTGAPARVVVTLP